MPNGGEMADVEKALEALERLPAPDEVLRGVAQGALEAFRLLDWASQQRAADDLAKRLVVALRQWDRKIKGLVSK